MAAVKKPAQPAVARLSSASRPSRAPSGDPGRAGAVRLALLAGAIAFVAGGLMTLVARHMLMQSASTQLETARESATRSLQQMLDETRHQVAALADEPRTATALRELRDGFLKSGKDPAAVLLPLYGPTSRAADGDRGRPADPTPYGRAYAQYQSWLDSVVRRNG